MLTNQYIYGNHFIKLINLPLSQADICTRKLHVIYSQPNTKSFFHNKFLQHGLRDLLLLLLLFFYEEFPQAMGQWHYS